MDKTILNRIASTAFLFSFSILIGLYGTTVYAGLADDLVDGVDKNVETLINRTVNLKSKTSDTLEYSLEIRDTIKDARLALTDDLISAIQDGLTMLDEIIATEKEGLALFLDANGDCSAASECFYFRNDLKQFLSNIEHVLILEY